MAASTRRTELGGVADLRQTAIPHQRLGIAAGDVELGEQLLGGRPVDRARIDKAEQAREPIDAETAVLQRHMMLVRQRRDIAALPVGGKFGWNPGGDEGLVGVRLVARVREHRGVVRGQPVLLLEPMRPGLGKLGQRRTHPLDESGVEAQRRQVGLGEVAVVVGLLLAALRDRASLRLDPAARLLHERSAGVEHSRLALDLELERSLHGAEGVHVLDLDLDAELLRTPEGAARCWRRSGTIPSRGCRRSRRCR